MMVATAGAKIILKTNRTPKSRQPYIQKSFNDQQSLNDPGTSKQRNLKAFDSEAFPL